MTPEQAVMDEITYALNHYQIYVIPWKGKMRARSWPMVDKLRWRGIVWRVNTGAFSVGKSFIRFGVPGLPDFEGWLFDGRRIAIEAKAPKSKLTEDQLSHMALSQDTGCIAFVAWSYQDVERNFKRFGLTKTA